MSASRSCSISSGRSSARAWARATRTAMIGARTEAMPSAAAATASAASGSLAIAPGSASISSGGGGASPAIRAAMSSRTLFRSIWMANRSARPCGIRSRSASSGSPSSNSTSGGAPSSIAVASRAASAGLSRSAIGTTSALPWASAKMPARCTGLPLASVAVRSNPPSMASASALAGRRRVGTTRFSASDQASRTGPGRARSRMPPTALPAATNTSIAASASAQRSPDVSLSPSGVMPGQVPRWRG